MSTKQRMICAEDLRFPGFMRAPHEAKPTAMGLWLMTDPAGRRELIAELIAGDLYPGTAATDMVKAHLLMLDESGFLTIFHADGSPWVQLLRPLKADLRGVRITSPTPPHGSPWESMAVGGGRERAEGRVRGEGAERASVWAEWVSEQERAPRRPVRPLLLDAPPIGCPDHPHGRFADCGPCGTARRRHDRWVAQERYTEELSKHDAHRPDDTTDGADVHGVYGVETEF